MSYSDAKLHKKEREALANNLELDLETFDSLVESSNYAYEKIKKLGPFYGSEENKEPTFRITAKPVILPYGSKKTLRVLGQDLLHLSKALEALPEEYKKQLAPNLDFRTPPAWRIDVIVDGNNQLKVNEIEGQDGASALMVAEQLAYNLQTLRSSTAARFGSVVKSMVEPVTNGQYKIAHIRVDNQHNTNADRFIRYVEKVTGGSVSIDHINEHDVIEGTTIPDWNAYSGVILETSYSPQKFYDLGLNRNKVISVGINNAFVNKGVFALFFEKNLKSFWKNELGKRRFERLSQILIPTYFVKNLSELKKARMDGKVVKVSWAGENAHLVNRSKGVAIPDNTVEQGSDERWDLLKELLEKGVRIVAQDYIIPAKYHSYLRKKGISLEPVDWYNRVCVKYVAKGNPNSSVLPKVTLTAAEVTLGPEVVPAGRKCAFTAGILS